jgi:protein-S-isoprenylcysteine O-methyltransferase Ste14
MRRHWFPKAYADFAARLRVPFGFLLAISFVWLATPSVTSLMAGFPASALGLLLRGWAAGYLAKNESLATGGPYAYVRNPLYLGTLLVVAGLVIAARRPLLAVLVGTVFVLVYLPVIELEEQHLRALFPEFAEYQACVPMLWPRLRPRPSPARFRWQLYLRNQEYQALAAFIAAFVLLAWKA